MATAVKQRLEKLILESPGQPQADDLNQFFAGKNPEFLQQQSIDFYNHLLPQYSRLALEYKAFCAFLLQRMSQKEGLLEVQNSQSPDAILQTLGKENLETAIAMAKLLACFYDDHLNLPEEARKLKEEYEAIEQFLQKSWRKLYVEIDKSSTAKIRYYINLSNPWRLNLIRLKRLINVIGPLFKDANALGAFFFEAHKALHPLDRPLDYLGWLFFVPRLSVNLFLLAKHTIPNRWMTAKEKELDWQTRFLTQLLLDNRWFEIANDIVWLAGGLLNCFVFIGRMASVVPYSNLVLFGYDVLLAVIRLALTIYQLEEIENQYILVSLSEEEECELKNFKEHLYVQLDIEYAKVILLLITTILLFIAIVLVLPVFAAATSAPTIVGVVLLFSATIVNSAISIWLDRQKPDDKLGKKLNTLFAPKAVTNNIKPESSETKNPTLNPHQP